MIARRCHRRPALMAAVVLLSCLLALLVGCGGGSGPTAGTTETRTDLILASTTSTQDSGFFDALIPAFNEAYPQYTVKVVAVGSGEALKLGETGDADVLLVHSPALEETFMENGFGVERRPVMYNDFVVVGSGSDPAEIRGSTTAAEAFGTIAAAEALFFSRGDESGTHGKELALWKAAGVEPSGGWYQVTGQGMGETLTIADQREGYTLADRATYLTKQEGLALEILFEGDPALFNQYHIITAKNGRNLEGARAFLEWIVLPQVQEEVIAPFGQDIFGQRLFNPNANPAG